MLCLGLVEHSPELVQPSGRHRRRGPAQGHCQPRRSHSVRFRQGGLRGHGERDVCLTAPPSLPCTAAEPRPPPLRRASRPRCGGSVAPQAGLTLNRASASSPMARRLLWETRPTSFTSTPLWATRCPRSRLALALCAGGAPSRHKAVPTPDGANGVQDVAYSPDGTMIAAADGQRNVSVYDAASGELACTVACSIVRHVRRKSTTGSTTRPRSTRWPGARIRSALPAARSTRTSSSGASRTRASASPSRVCCLSATLAPSHWLSGAHPTADLTNLAWLSNTTLLTSGHDVCFRLWEVKLE